MTTNMPRHHAAIILLHWLTALLVTLAVLLVLGREWLEGDAIRQRVLDLHRLFGLGLLAIAAGRLVLSRALGAAKVNGDLPAPFPHAAALSHGALYLLLVTLPLLGWLQWSASGKAMWLFGALPVPALIGHDRDLAETLSQWHEGVAWALIALIAAHALAALWHHYGRRDQVLSSMLPRGQRSALAPATHHPVRSGSQLFSTTRS